MRCREGRRRNMGWRRKWRLQTIAQCNIVEKYNWRKVTTNSKTVSHIKADNLSETHTVCDWLSDVLWQTIFDWFFRWTKFYDYCQCYGTEEEGYHGATGAEAAYDQNRVEQLVSQSLAVMHDKAGSLATGEIIYLLNQENFNLSVFSEMMKSSGDCQVIT